MITFGIAGLVMASIAIWINNEKKQNILFILGGFFLLAYSLSIENTIFSILQVVFILSALAELISLKKKR